MKKIPDILIINGPNKFDFIFRLFSTEGCARYSVPFIVRNETKNVESQLELMINSISWKDCTGERFFFEGSDGNTKVKGCYNTTTKAGYIEFV